MLKIDERELAVNILMEITIEGAYNNIILRKTLDKNGAATQVQRAFITELVNGVLRNLMFLDFIINKFSKIKTTKMKPLILNILRISVYQINFMDKVPPFAVCNEAVSLVKKRGLGALSGFVNGVLRSILRDLESITFPDKDKLPKEYLSVKYSYPKWLVDKFYDDFDNNFDLIEDIFQTNNKPPKVTLCINTLKTNKSELVEILKSEGVTVKDAVLFQNALNISSSSNIKTLDSFKKGLYHVMDESAMLSVAALNPSPGQTVMDICAAPGGKSLLSAYIMENKGHIISRDIHPHKKQLIDESALRLGINIIKTELSDATAFNNNYEETADALLIDAPCSGFGLIRKKPDIKYAKTMDDVANLSALQREILSASWRYLKPGGTLVYSTCTLTKQENEENIEWFLNNFPFEPGDMSSLMPNGITKTNAGYITILPHQYETDGFFIARFIRKA